jgi:HD-like signal output (HDOD) protein
MIAFLMTLAIIIILIMLIVVLLQNKKEVPASKKNIKFALHDPALSHEEKSPDLKPAFSQSPTASAPDNELGLSDAYADLRQHLKKGIDCIFDEGASEREDRTRPFTRQDIKPQLLEDVRGHIAGLSHFRTEQVRLQKMLNDPSVQMTDLSKIILSDPVMTAKTLRMANSSYFGIQQKIDSISHALMILGLVNIKNILYREGMHQLFQAESPMHRETVAALWRHSNLTSVCAHNLHNLFDGLNRGSLFTLGIIHDIGKLILLELPQAKLRAIDFWGKYPDGILIREEDQLLGINHAVIGGMALESWSFSELMIDVVSAHHVPPYVEADQTGLNDEKLKYAIVLFLADQLAGLFTDWNEGIVRPYPLHKSYSALIDKNKLLNKILDTNFLAQIREVERLAMDEKENKINEIPERQVKTL